jgi:NTP pyrophosphatase (non-canonical NTP hydrolase)
VKKALVCEFEGCSSEVFIGSRLCLRHLEQIDEINSETPEKSINNKVQNDYEELVDYFSGIISDSEQMRNLAIGLMEDGPQNLVKSFPSLSNLSQESLEQIMSFMTVNVVSSIIQERSHLLARAVILAQSMSEDHSFGIKKMIELEISSLNKQL